MRPAKPTCSDCGHEVLWAITEGKAKIALNPKRDDDNGRFACYKDVHGDMRARVPTPDNRRDTWEHMHDPHIATCPAETERRRVAQQPLAPVVPISHARSY